MDKEQEKISGEEAARNRAAGEGAAGQDGEKTGAGQGSDGRAAEAAGGGCHDAAADCRDAAGDGEQAPGAVGDGEQAPGAAGDGEQKPGAADGEEQESGSGGSEASGGGDREASDKNGQETSDGKWNFFGKKKKDPRDVQIEELTDRLRRTMAEFDNFRKRTEKEKSAMFEIGARDIIERILPVIDNFERGLASMPEELKGTPFASGMEMIYKQLLKNLEDAGVKPIEAAGKPFDPGFHNAVMHVEDENLGENVVVQELQKGYMYRDSVVRHSMVQVAN